MKLNQFVMAISVLTALSMSNAFAAAGTVNFTGEILDTACTVDVASQNQTVVLGAYNRSEFTTTGDTTAAKKFNIVLKDCPISVSSAHVAFDGQPDIINSSLLAIDSSVPGAATGVAINLKTADKVDLGLHADNGYRYTLVTNADNTLEFYAQYKSTATAVTAGPANSVANFSVVYN